ncbi:hypothetical protein KZZ52_01825 [Dactylosporangium sp. AC04546]|uniref:hypothetical protein n=1 Tax=Dactylosporangium sp. AC04546 TaxID=2862460 RepID=UPI002E7AED3B|nr:hypothetical protein [Dactylosporangium sp. AC04546]WVK84199.1 hypothetical protein KZZ52_01825 [Dactylosporangium sp. AC04546]
MKRLCLVLTAEMNPVVKENLDYGDFLDLKLESTVLLRPRTVLLRLTTTPATRDDLSALIRDGNDGGYADYLLLSTVPSPDEHVRTSQHYFGPDDVLDLCKRSHFVGWAGGRPIARGDAYSQARRRAGHLAELDNIGLTWLPALSRNRLPWPLRNSPVPANEWFEIATFRLATRLFRIDGVRLGAAGRAKRVGDALLWSQGTLVLLDCKAAQDGYRLEVDDERRLVEYAKQQHDGLPVGGKIKYVVLVSSAFPCSTTTGGDFKKGDARLPRSVAISRVSAPMTWSMPRSSSRGMPMTHDRLPEVEGSGLRRFGTEGQAGVGEEAGQEVGAVLDALEPVAHDGGEVVHAGHGEVAQAAFDV